VFRRILVAIDGSPATLVIARVAAALAAATGGRVHTCFVIDSATINASPSIYRDRLREELRRESAGSLRKVRRICEAIRVPSSGSVVEGDAARRILAAARRFRADLIALSTRAPGRVGILLQGSVAVDLVGRAPCPVLLVRRGSRIRIATRRHSPRRTSRR
jgi:nucleotide-binding universal stress UspA family protein